MPAAVFFQGQEFFHGGDWNEARKRVNLKAFCAQRRFLSVACLQLSGPRAIVA